MEQDQEVREPEQVEAVAAEDKGEAVARAAGAEALEAVLRQARADTASAPTVVKEPPIN